MELFYHMPHLIKSSKVQRPLNVGTLTVLFLVSYPCSFWRMVEVCSCTCGSRAVDLKRLNSGFLSICKHMISDVTSILIMSKRQRRDCFGGWVCCNINIDVIAEEVGHTSPLLVIAAFRLHSISSTITLCLHVRMHRPLVLVKWSSVWMKPWICVLARHLKS